MAKLMQKYAQEDEDDEDRALPGGFGAALSVINRAEAKSGTGERSRGCGSPFRRSIRA
jgi:hypothetical protein